MKHRQAAVTPAAGRRRRVALPTASRPHMPGYGVPASAAGLLPWDWAERRLTRSHNYWLITVRPDGRPHAMPVWGVWVDGAFYFNGGRESRKVRNLATNRRCIVCGERADEAVIVEGVALRVRGQKALARVTRPYQAKYRSRWAPAGGLESRRDEPGCADAAGRERTGHRADARPRLPPRPG